MTRDPWSPNSRVKSIIRTKVAISQKKKKKTALKEFLLSHVFYSERSMFFSSSVGMTFILAGYLTTLDGDTLTSVGH